MITKHIEGRDWLTDSPSFFAHGNVVVKFVGRHWGVYVDGVGDLECSFGSRVAAMLYAKTYYLGDFGRGVGY